jgi:aminopeptidase N
MLPWLLMNLATAAPSDVYRSVFKHPVHLTSTERKGSLENWDMEHYDLNVELHPETRTVDAQVTITARARNEAPPLMRLNANGPIIDSIVVDGTETTWTETVPNVMVTIPSTVPTDGLTEVVVHYTVPAPDGDGFLGVNWGDPIHTFHEPRGARKWLVVNDDPADKATLAWHIRVPSELSVIANGVREEPAVHDDGTTTHSFHFEDPIPTYLMALHAGTYSHHLDESGPIDVHTWAQPELFDQAVDDFANTSEMIDFFSDLWVPYPWTHYANVTAPFSGAMEHTTATTFGMDLVGDERAEFVNAHEIAHHWFGDLATLNEWPEIWLNEGFASYAEVLWVEQQYGETTAIDYLQEQRASYLAWQELEGMSTLYDPLFMWGGLVYDKGSIVVHMLRHTVGDDAFFAAMTNYLGAHAHGNVTTGDLQLALEETHGSSLEWFFTQWVYQARDPAYLWGLTQIEMDDGTWQVDIHIEQRAEGSWSMPIEVSMTDVTGQHEMVVAQSGDGTVVTTFCRESMVETTQFNPRSRTLYSVAERDDSAFWPEEVSCGTVDGSTTPPEPEAPDAALADAGPATRPKGCSCAGAPPAVHWPWSFILALVCLVRRDQT